MFLIGPIFIIIIFIIIIIIIIFHQKNCSLFNIK